MRPLQAGQLRDRITFQRYEQTEDDFGGLVDATEPTIIRHAWAQVIYGKGSERREAARESASVPATFLVRADSVTRGIGPDVQIAFGGATWDIVSAVPFGRDGMEFTATKAVQS